MNKSAEVTRSYYELLLDIDESGELRSIHDEFAASLIQKDVVYAGKPLSRFLAPLFVTAQERDQYQDVTEAIMRCVEKVLSTCRDVPAMAELLSALAPGEYELLQTDRGYHSLLPICRLDAFVVDGVVRFCEFNCDTPGAIGCMDGLADSLRETPVMKTFAERYQIGVDPLLPATLQCLRTCYGEWCEAVRAQPSANPRIAIVTMLERDPSIADMKCIKRYFAEQGHDCVLSDVADGVYEDGTYLISGEPVDIVLRRGLGGWWVEHSQAYHALKRAMTDGAVCVVNPLISQLGGKKSLFAVMQSEQVRARLDPDERALIDTHLPWTRPVKAGNTTFRGDTIDLIPFIAGNRDHLVLKPVAQCGGKNVLVGRAVDDQAWQESIRIASAGGYIVQEYIPIPTVDLPTLAEDGRLTLEQQKANINFYSIDGRYAGTMVRVSNSDVINIGAGGGAIPLFYVTDEV